jgi:two-component system CheB/CheR fusion protein
MKKDNKSEDGARLREKAEALLKKKSVKAVPKLSETDIQRLVHELEVHQVELELENEELRLAKGQLEVASEKIIELYDFAPSGYFALSKEGKIEEVNLSGAKILGQERSRLVNRLFGLYVSENTRQVFIDFLEKVFESKTKEACEVTLSFNDNLPMYVYITGIVAENGEQCLVAAIDITERKRAEEALIMSENELKKAQEITHIGSWYLNVATNQVKWTEELYKMYGFDPALPPPLYTDHQKLFTKESWETLSSSLAKTRDTGIPYELELKTIREDGSNGWMWVRGETVHDKEGKTVGLWGAAQDISERKKAEEALREALLKAEESDRLKTAFINNISHEVRTPLSGILGFGQLMTEPDISAEDKAQYLEVLNKSGYRLINTITNIMDISLIVSGGMEVRKKTYNVKQLLEEIRLRFGKQCTEKNLSLSLHTPEETDNTEIHTDAELLGKILFHLLDNAVKFTNTGGITFGYIVDSNSYRFFVRDTGVGVKPTAQNRIFDNFIQENISNTRGHEGSGLGLSIARGLMELLGGEIGLESVKGKGSTFFFTIPSGITAEDGTAEDGTAEGGTAEGGTAEGGTAAGGTAAGGTAAGGTAIKHVILIAEDDETCLALIKAILKDLTVELLSAKTGKEAVSFCRERSDISLILMDLKMPVMNGFEAAKLIKSFRKDLPIIAVTAHAETGAEHRAISAGCDDYITKPFNKDKLIAMIKKSVKC